MLLFEQGIQRSLDKGRNVLGRSAGIQLTQCFFKNDNRDWRFSRGSPQHWRRNRNFCTPAARITHCPSQSSEKRIEQRRKLPRAALTQVIVVEVKHAGESVSRAALSIAKTGVGPHSEQPWSLY